MATPQQPPEPWYEAAIEIMLHDRVPLLMAVTRLGAFEVPLTPEEAAAHERRKSFQAAYRAATNRLYATEAAAVKEKDLVLGRMARNAGALESMGKPKEANDSLAAIAKINGWSSPDVAVSFAETPAEIAEMRRKLLDELASRPPAPPVQ